MTAEGSTTDRRTLLTRSAATLGLTATGGLPALAASEGRLPLADLHIHAAARAKALRAGRDITLRTLLPKGCEDNVEPVAKAFEDMTGLKMSLEWSDLDRINDRLMLDFMTGSAAHDLALPASFGIPDLASAGILLNLQPFADRHEPPELRVKELYQVADFFQGKPYGFQADGDVYVMFYNRPWLEDADQQKRFADRHGYALDIAKTWDELDAQMAFFHDPDNGRYGGMLFRNPDYLVWEWWLRFHAKGGVPLTDQLYPAINSAAGEEALVELISATRFLHPECRTAGLFRNWELFAAGHSFANIGWGGTQKYLNRETSAMRGKLAIGATPGEYIDGRIKPVSHFNWGWDYTVLSLAAQPELAYLFALFASSPEMSTVAVRGRNGYFDPFREEHYDDPEIRAIYTDEFLQVHRQSLRQAIPDLYLRGHGDYMGSLKSHIMMALSADLTPRHALDNAAKEWRLISVEKGIEAQREQWRYLRGMYRRS